MAETKNTDTRIATYRATFVEGVVELSMPDKFSPEGLEELKQWWSCVLMRYERHALAALAAAEGE